MSDSYLMDEDTLRKVLKMIDYIFTGLCVTKDAKVKEDCASKSGRQQLCAQFAIPMYKPGPGDDMVNYEGSPSECMLSESILNSFEKAMGGTLTPSGGDISVSGLGSLVYTRLFYAFQILLSQPDIQKQFISASQEERMKLLSGLAMEDKYGEETALSEYSQDKPNTPLARSMKDIEQTLYNQYRFIC